jgi:FSR family fosmidomycin resistance protein-like MFS transporter
MFFFMWRDKIAARWNIGILSAGHGLNDLIAGFLLGNLVYLNHDKWQLAGGFFIYTLLAFGGQWPVALMGTRLSSLRWLLPSVFLLNLLAILLFAFLPFYAMALAGIASAVYHVQGGSLCSAGKAAAIGWFAAPGIAGLTMGGYFSFLHSDCWLILELSCLAFSFLLWTVRNTKFFTCSSSGEGISKHEGSIATPQLKNISINLLDRHDAGMILLLGIISLRSAVWNVAQLVHEMQWTWLLVLAACACLGKLIGGWLSDRIGWRIYSLVTMAVAFPLITLFRRELILFSIGIGLLQSAIPAHTALLIQYREKVGQGVALSFGTAVISGAFLIFPLQWLGGYTVLFLLLSLMVMISYWWNRSLKVKIQKSKKGKR